MGGLRAEQWELPSACAEWQVREGGSHLIGGAERQAESMERGRGGDSNPPAGFVAPEPGALSAANAQRDIDRRDQLAGRFLESFDASYEKLHQEFDEFAKSSWDTLCWHIRRGAMTAASYVELRIQELAIHDWDMRSAFQPGAGLDPACVPVLLDMSPRWLGLCVRPSPPLAGPGGGPTPACVPVWLGMGAGWRGRCFRPSAPLPKPVVYGFIVDTGVGSHHDRITGTGDAFQMDTRDAPQPEDEEASQADLSLTATAENYLLFTYGRLTAAEGLHLGKLTVQGDLARLDQFEVWFKCL